jgi:hypothetical protein
MLFVGNAGAIVAILVLFKQGILGLGLSKVVVASKKKLKPSTACVTFPNINAGKI